MSAYMIASGSNTVQNTSANQLPGELIVQNLPGSVEEAAPVGTINGHLIAVRFLPGDAFIKLTNPFGNSAIGGNQSTSLIVESSPITASQRNSTLRFICEAAYEIRFLFNIPGGSVIDYSVSLNG
jgi:hypothetical protein